MTPNRSVWYPVLSVRAATFFKTSTANSLGSITMPSGIQSGDIAVMTDLCLGNSIMPVSVVPTGFTLIAPGSVTSTSGSINLRFNVSYKVLTGAETVVVGMVQDQDQKSVIVFRKSSGAWGAPYSPSAAVDANSPSSIGDQTITPTGATPAVLVAYELQSSGGGASCSMSPAGTDNGDFVYLIYAVGGSPVSNTVTYGGTHSGSMGSLAIDLGA